MGSSDPVIGHVVRDEYGVERFVRTAPVRTDLGEGVKTSCGCVVGIFLVVMILGIVMRVMGFR